MTWASDDLAILYADFGVEVCRSNGAPSFMALKGVSDDGVFDTATISEHSIRYPTCNELFEGEEVTIDGRAYKVPKAPPRRLLDGLESVVELIPL